VTWRGDRETPAQTIARLRGARRVWTIAGIYGAGAAPRLVKIHDRIGERIEDGDRLVYLGNYYGCGDAVRATIDELVDFRRRVLARRRGFACDVTFLHGAHEEMLQKLLQLQFAANPVAVLRWMVEAGIEPTLRAYGGDLRVGLAAARNGPRTLTRWTSGLRAAINAAPGHMMLLSALRHAAFTEEGGLLFVHAAVDPAKPLAVQRDAFGWGRHDILALAAPFAGFLRVVAGVDRQRRGVVECEFATVVDGGTATGGPLVAACFGGWPGRRPGRGLGHRGSAPPRRADCRGGGGLRQRLAI
jgi:serine/threonine protein phosphatase 1